MEKGGGGPQKGLLPLSLCVQGLGGEGRLLLLPLYKQHSERERVQVMIWWRARVEVGGEMQISRWPPPDQIVAVPCRASPDTFSTRLIRRRCRAQTYKPPALALCVPRGSLFTLGHLGRGARHPGS